MRGVWAQATGNRESHGAIAREGERERQEWHGNTPRGARETVRRLSASAREREREAGVAWARRVARGRLCAD